MNMGAPKLRSETIDAAESGGGRGEAPAAQEGAKKRPRGASRDLFGQFAPKSIVGQVALLIALAIA